MKRLLYVVIVFGLIGFISLFSNNFMRYLRKHPVGNPKTNLININNIEKKGIIRPNAIESTPFVWEGKLYYLVSEKNADHEKIERKLNIFSFPENKKVVTVANAFGMSLASAMVDNKTLHIFATKDWDKYGKSTVYLFSSNDLIHFTKPTPIYKAREKEGLFNTSVTKNTDNHEFTMAIEFDYSGYTTFSIRFLKSNDLINWIPVEDYVFGKDIYAACPTIKYINGKYYLWYAVTDNRIVSTKTQIYKIKLAMSENLKDWVISKHDFLTPQGNEGINNSDVDLTEFNKRTHIFYADGNQATWGNIRHAVYNDSIESLINKMFY